MNTIEHDSTTMAISLEDDLLYLLQEIASGIKEYDQPILILRCEENLNNCYWSHHNSILEKAPLHELNSIKSKNLEYIINRLCDLKYIELKYHRGIPGKFLTGLDEVRFSNIINKSYDASYLEKYWLVYFIITPRGWHFLSGKIILSKQIFLLTPFNSSLSKLLNDNPNIRDIIFQQTGYYIEYIISEKIDIFVEDEIIAGINRSEAIIGDITVPNVHISYFLGYARALHRKNILVSYKNEHKEVIDSHRFLIAWEGKDDLLKYLINRINALLHVQYVSF